MTTEELEKMVRHGETSHVQFKQRFTTPKQMAEDSHVEFVDSKQGNQFTARVSRLLAAGKAVSGGVEAVSSIEKSRSNDEFSRSSVEKSRSNEEKSRSKAELLLDFCAEPRSLTEIAVYLGMKEKYNMKKKYIDPLLGESLSMTEPDSPNSPTQKYVAIKNR